MEVLESYQGYENLKVQDPDGQGNPKRYAWRLTLHSPDVFANSKAGFPETENIERHG